MKKKMLIFTMMLLIVFTLTACGKNKEIEDEKITSNDALNFKEEYEALNNIKNENNGKVYRKVNIQVNNPFVYKEASDIVDMINNKESFIVYFGFAKCPWCRSIIETLINVANDYDVDTIYYVDVYDIRDTLKLDNGNVVIDKEGTDDYMKLIKLLDNVLDDYNLTDNDGNSISTGEKRIYAPNIVAIVNGKAVGLETGISDSQEDGYQELTTDMLDESYEKLASVIKLLKSNTCSLDSKC